MNSHKTRSLSIAIVLAFTFIITAYATQASGSLTWPSWIPTTYSSLGWTCPVNGTSAKDIDNILINPANGAANMTPMYSQLILNGSGDVLLTNYIDFEAATGANLTGNIFDLPVPQDRTELDATLAKYTQIPFTGTTLWELVVFTFENTWNAHDQAGLVLVETATIGQRPAVLLNYQGYGDLGYVAFVNMGNKAGLFVNIASNDSLANDTTFGTSIQQFVSGLLAPLVEITYAASFDQSSILPSGSLVQGQSCTPASTSIHPASSLFLSQQDFLNITSALVSAIPVESFPFKFSVNQVIIVILLVVAIGVVIYFGLTSYQKQKSKIHD